MDSFRILYLEHEDERHFYKAAMESVSGVKVDVLTYPEKASLETYLKSNRYELIITDANFLLEDHSHDDDELGEYKLDLVLSTVRDIDKRTKIAVLTNYSPALLKDHSNDLNMVDYLWEKKATPDDFIKWQILAIKREVNRLYPEHTLLNKLNLLLTNDKFDHPWKQHLVKMIDRYKSKTSEKDQIDTIRKNLADIAGLLNIRVEFEKLMNVIVDMELFNIAGKPASWGHLRHVINVFWLGFYILNSGLINRQAICSKLNLSSETDVDTIWFIASIFHDIGYLGEISEKVVEKCNNLTAIYPGNPIRFQGIEKNQTNIQQYVSKIQTKLPPQISVFVGNNVVTKYSCDHGVLSAVTLANHFRSISEIDNLATIASASVIIHNLIPPKVNNSELSTLSFKDYPLGVLLIICDLIQAWERETGRESFRSDIPLETVEMSALTIDTESKTIRIEINYLPFKYILPTDIAMMQAEEKLRENLTTYVLPALGIIKLDHHTDFSITIIFLLDGRSEILRYTS